MLWLKTERIVFDNTKENHTIKTQVNKRSHILEDFFISISIGYYFIRKFRKPFFICYGENLTAMPFTCPLKMQ